MKLNASYDNKIFSAHHRTQSRGLHAVVQFTPHGGYKWCPMQYVTPKMQDICMHPENRNLCGCSAKKKEKGK